MLRKLKKSVAVVLVATFLMSMFAIAPSAAEKEENGEISATECSVTGNNSAGNLIASEIEDYRAQMEETDGSYVISDIQVNGSTATVSYTAESDCNVLVALYDENTDVMLASGKTKAESDKTAVDVTIETDNIPTAFVVRGFILGDNNAPLGESYCSEMYTTEIQELKKKTVDDFAPEEVLNFDEDNKTNFGVYSDNIKKITSNDKNNVIQSVNEDTVTYVFSNADESLISLKRGDIFVCGEGSDNSVILKVGNITVDGTTVTIVGDETSLEEVFEYVKIEGKNDIENAEVDESTMSEGVTYLGDSDEKSLDKKADSKSDKVREPVGAVNVDTSAGKSKDFDIVDNKFASATVTISAEASLDIYISKSRQVFDFTLTVGAAYNISIFAKYDKDFDLATIRISIVGRAISVGFTPGVYFTAETKLELELSASTIIGFGYSDKGGFHNNCQKPHSDGDLGIEGSFEFGLTLKIGVIVAEKWVGYAGLEGKFGFEFSVEPTKTNIKIEGVEVEHSCKRCISGDVNFVITITPFLQLFKNDVLEDVFGDDLELKVKPGDKPLAQWYFSFDHKKGGLGACQYLNYTLPIKVVKDGVPLANVSVMEYESLCTSLGETDEIGRLSMILPGVKFGFYHIFIDETSIIFSIQDKKNVRVLENGEWVTFSESPNFKDGYYVIDLSEPVDPTPQPTTKPNPEPGPDPQPTTKPGPTIIDSGTCGNNATWELWSDGKLNINGSGDMDDYNCDNPAPWYDNRTLVKQLYIGDGITGIGEEAFCDCINLNSISINDNITSVGVNAFDYTAYLMDESNWNNDMLYIGSCLIKVKTSITGNYTIKSNTKCIADYAFYNCNNLEGITIPDSVMFVGEKAFFNCDLKNVVIGNKVPNLDSFDFTDSLKSITIGDSISSIESIDFTKLNNLESIAIGKGVTNIKEKTFYECKNLKYVIIGSGVKSIGNYAFYGCSGIRNITIPDSVTYIGEKAFYSCNLENVVIGDKVPNLDSFDFTSMLSSIIIGKSVTKVDGSTFFGCSNLTSITIPDSVTYIGDYAFYGCSSLTSITIPDSVTSIGSHAFEECSSLKSITIPNGVTEISRRTFSDCTSLTSITIPDSVTSIGEYAFYNCKNLENVTIGNNVTEIGSDAFCKCSSLISITIPDSVTKIGSDAFYDCSSLASITIPDSVASIGDCVFINTAYYDNDDNWNNNVLYIDNHLIKGSPVGKYYIKPGTRTIADEAFYDWNNLYILVMPDSITSIGDDAFSYCSNLTDVTISNNAKSIGNDAFYSCESLTSVTIPDSVTDIGCYAFGYCKNLESVTIGNSVKEIGSGAFEMCSSLTSITIPNSVTSIGDVAFNGCSSLTSITIPNGVTEIGYKTFFGCSSLTSIIIPGGVTNIGYYAFSGCSSLTSITIPNSVTSISNYAFYGCSSITKATISNGVTSIEKATFAGCSSLTGIIIPNSVTSIGDDAFSGCSSLISITIPNSVTSISNYAFSGCSSITSIAIPNSVLSIGNDAFSGCSSLKKFNVSEYNKNYSSADGVLFNKDKTSLLTCPAGKVGEYIIPDSVTSIKWDAFEGCSSLTSITIPDSVTDIGWYTFKYCTNLESVTIGNSVKSIGFAVFSECTSLKSITIPDSVTSIGEAFNNCTNLESITIGNSVTSIDKDAFIDTSYYNNADNWENDALYIGKYLIKVKPSSDATYNIKSGTLCIADGAFSGCTNLSSITIPNSVTSIGDGAFSGCTSLPSITIPNSVTSIGGSAFFGCTNLSSITIPNSVTSIEGYTFFGCTNLSSITIPNSVTNIGSYTFSRCTSLTSITIPNSVTSIRDGAFSGCTGLTSITIPDSVTSIEEHVFDDCSGLTSITIPYGVTSIQSYAFEGCTNLSSITIPDSVTSIRYYVFNDCTNLESVTIGNSVTSIGGYAFKGCTSLTSITIPDSVTSLGDYLFRDSALKTIYGYSGSYVETYANKNKIKFVALDDNSESSNENSVVSAAYVNQKTNGDNNRVGVSYAKATYNIVSTQLLSTNADTSKITAEYSKTPYADYIIAVVKDPNAEDLLSADNLLYINQYTADKDGKISVSMPVSDDVGNDYEVLIFGAEGGADVPDTPKKGDVNGDGKVNIDDVTLIQKYLANMAELDSIQLKAADVNGDENANIDDVTIIQKFLAGMVVLE